MKLVSPALVLASLVTITAMSAQPISAAPGPVASMAELEALARGRTNVAARVPLAPATADLFRGADTFEEAGTGRVPNYLRALANKPSTVRAFAHLVKTFAYDGSVSPAVKLAMAVRIAQVNRSAYGAAHLVRLLRNTGSDGEALLAKLRTGQLDQLPPADRLALRWAELQTQDIHGMTDDEFRQLRGYYNDSEVVELTFTVCLFNYFTRMVEGLGLPVEPWVLDPASKPAPVPAWQRDRSPARVALISDAEIEGSGAALRSRPGARRPATRASGSAWRTPSVR